MEKERKKKSNKKIVLALLLLLLLMLCATIGTVIGRVSKSTTKLNGQEAVDDASEVEQTLRERLAAEGTEKIEISEDIEITGGPLIVNGNKELTGSGSLVAVDGFAEGGALLAVSDGAELEIEGIKLDANQMAEYAVHAKEASKVVIGKDTTVSNALEYNVFNEGTLTMSGATVRKGKVGVRNAGNAVMEDVIVAVMDKYLVDNRQEGTLEIKDGTYMSSSGYGIYNRGELTMTGGEINNNNLMGVCNLGDAYLKDVKVNYNASHNIMNKSCATLTAENVTIEKSGVDGFHNEPLGVAILRDCHIKASGSANVVNWGEMEIYDLLSEESTIESVINTCKAAHMYMEDSTLTTTNVGHGIYNRDGAVLEVKDTFFKDLKSRAIQNKAGTVTATNLTVDGTGGASIGNDEWDDGTYGHVTVTGLKVLKTTSHAVNNRCEGSITIKDASICAAPANVVCIDKGTVNLENVTLEGSVKKESGAETHAISLVEGCTLNVKNCSIESADTRGIMIWGGTANIDGLTIKDTGGAAIGATASAKGDVTMNNVTITNAGTNNIVNEGTGTFTVTNCVFNLSNGGSVRAANGTIILKDTKVLGTADPTLLALNVPEKGTLIIKEGTTVTTPSSQIAWNRGTLIMEGGKIYGGNTDKAGAAIANDGTLIIKGGTICDNVSRVSGGAIYNAGHIEMSGGTIENNQAIGYGGAINITSKGSMVMTGGTIRNNEAKSGVNAGGSKAVGNGGAINVSGECSFEMSGGIIENNTAPNMGGAIRSNADQIIITGGIIRDNEAGSSGGAIGLYPASDGTLPNNIIENVEISNNKAEGTAAAIFIGDNRNVVIGKGTVISGNEAEEHGGAINLAKASNLTINGGTIKNNTANGGNGGGAIYLSTDAKLEMTAGTIKNNTANGSRGGGAIYASVNTEFVMTGGTISGNTAAGSSGGGAIYAGEGATLAITNAAIKSNTAEDGSAGAIYIAWVPEDETEPGVVLNDTTISGNTSSSSAGAIFVSENRHLEINEGTVISDNTAKDHGGAINLAGGAMLTMDGGEISNNIAECKSNKGGGAIYMSGKSEFTMNGGTISGNKAITGKAKDFGGGGIYVAAKAVLNITGGTISDNQSYRGGAIYFYEGSDGDQKDEVYTATIENVTITGNTTSIKDGRSGGAINIGKYRKLVINEGTEISGNTSGSGGGAIDIAGTGATLVMNDGAISGNTAGGDGGAIYVSGGSDLTITGGTISENKAKTAGAIYVNGNSVSITNATISGNEATTGSAGAILVAKDRTVIVGDGTTISGNTSAQHAGAINIAGNGTLTMTGGSITGNTAKGGNGGGGVYMSGSSKFNMSGGTISGNTAESNKDGGGIYVAKKSELNITGGTIKENTANKGGAIYLISGDSGDQNVDAYTITLQNVEIKDNTANWTGGAIFVGNCRKVVMNTGAVISGNTSARGGGAIMLDGGDSTLIMNGGEIKNNTDAANPEYKGNKGSVYISGNSVFIMNGGTISENKIAGAQTGQGVYCNGKTFELGANATITDAIYLNATTPITVTGQLNNAVGAITLNPNNFSAGNTVIKGSTDTDKFDLANEGYVLAETNNDLVLATLVEVNNYADLKKVVEEATGAKSIVITTDIAMEGTITVPASTKITLSGSNMLTRPATNTEAFFNIASGATMTMTGNLKLDGGYATNNAIKAKAPLIINNGTLNIKDNVTLQNNYNNIGNKNPQAGAIHVAAQAALNMTGGTISGNTGNRGGAIYITTGNASDLNNNSYAVNLTNVTLSDNDAKWTGGAIFVGNYRKVVMNDGTQINGNTSVDGGGAIMLDGAGSTLIMNDGKISENTAGNGGGAIYMSGSAVFTMTDGEISENTANGTKGGGGVYIAKKTTVAITGGKINDNTSTAGGGIYVVNGDEADKANKNYYVSISGVDIKDNDASDTAGAIFIAEYRTVIVGDGTEISGNTSANHAGAINIVSTGTLTMTGGSITGNTAKGGNGGGGVYMSGGSIFNMSGGTISGNIDETTNGRKDLFVQGTVTLSGNAEIEELFWRNPNYKIQVDSSAGAFAGKIGIQLLIEEGRFSLGNTVITGSTDISKFELKNAGYKLTASGSNLILSAE